MDELFRFVNLRPPESVPPVGISIALETPLQVELATVRPGGNPWPAMVDTATQFVRSEGIFVGGAGGGYVKDISTINFHSQFSAFRATLTRPGQQLDLAGLQLSVQNIFGMDATGADTAGVIWDRQSTDFR